MSESMTKTDNTPAIVTAKDLGLPKLNDTKPNMATSEGNTISSKTEATGRLRKGRWTIGEDAILTEHVRRHKTGNWNTVRTRSGLARSGQSCRARWENHLNPGLHKGPLSPEEELRILKLYKLLGNKWACIASHVQGRTAGQIKNYIKARTERRRRVGLHVFTSEFSFLPFLLEGIN